MPLLAKIREEECIGCTKCIQACPVDAIIGASQQMHTVIIDECIGCQLCVEPCPVDCIDLIRVETLSFDPEKSKQRHRARKQRLRELELKQQDLAIPKQTQEKLDYIQSALQRVKSKRDESKNH